MATELHAAGASDGLTKSSGGWKSMGSLNKYIIETPYQKRKISNLLASTKNKNASINKPPEVSESQLDTPKKSPPSLAHGANGTVVQATSMGNMGAWNIQSCTVQIHHHNHTSPVKKKAKLSNPMAEEDE